MNESLIIRQPLFDWRATRELRIPHKMGQFMMRRVPKCSKYEMLKESPIPIEKSPIPVKPVAFPSYISETPVAGNDWNYG